jgi:hypothetical protein
VRAAAGPRAARDRRDARPLVRVARRLTGRVRGGAGGRAELAAARLFDAEERSDAAAAAAAKRGGGVWGRVAAWGRRMAGGG